MVNGLQKAQYDDIAREYSDSKAADTVTYVESPTLFAILGDMGGKSVLDLACGDGFYTRELKRIGAARVLGVDISQAMIDLAIDEERRTPLGIRYECANVSDLPDLGEFDVVVAAFLLHYSRDETELQTMCDSIARELPGGGRFVALNENPYQRPGRHLFYKKYGFVKTLAEPQQDGSRISYLMATGKRPFKFNVQYFAAETYERALAKSGFTDVLWHSLDVSRDGIEDKGEEFWREYLDNPPVIGLSARKG